MGAPSVSEQPTRVGRKPSPSQLGSHPSSERVYLADANMRESSGEVAARLSALALFYALGFIVAYGTGIILYFDRVDRLVSRFDFIAAMVSIGLTLGLFVVAHWRLVGERLLNLLALIWLTPATTGALLAEDWIWFFSHPTFASARGFLGLSYICVVIVIFPLLVRASIRQILVASLSAAIVGSASVACYALCRGLALSVGVLASITVPLLVCAVMSALPAWVMVRFRRKLAAARRLGSYQLVQRLGRGGMGEVWQARHDLLARPAAIKLIRREILRKGSADSEDSEDSESVNVTLSRFEREVQATASLQSPHTVSVYDFGITDDGAFYYVMEQLDGLDAQSLIERFGSIPAGRALGIITQVCHSLDEAHHNHLIHRDVKPANIFLCRLGRELDYVKVLDFGLVKNAPTHTDPRQELTQEGAAAGTPAYMAPEVALGEADVDGRSDLYSLGCVAYWLLTGRNVFRAESAMKVVLMHVRDEPVPPSRYAELPIPEAFEAAIMSCLAKDPADRPQSAAELLERLKACPPDEHWDPERSRRWWATHLPAA